MPMTDAYRNALRTHGQTLITKIGLVNASGVELASAGYVRQDATWNSPSAGRSQLATDAVFTITAGDVVAGWRGYGDDGTDYGGESLLQQQFSANGTYRLLAASTYIQHNAP